MDVALRRFQIALWILAALACAAALAQEPNAPQPTTQPVVPDAQLDEALTRAFAETTGPQFAEPMRSVAPRFREVPVSTEAGKALWHKVTLNGRGRQIDAIRFRVPEGEARDMAWAFIPPANLKSWYILPMEGEMEGFKQFWPADAQSVLGKKAPEGTKRVMLQALPATSLKLGGEYIVWFRFSDDKPAPLHLAITLPPTTGKRLNQSAVTQALGLTAEGTDLGVVDLDASTTQPSSR